MLQFFKTEDLLVEYRQPPSLPIVETRGLLAEV